MTVSALLGQTLLLYSAALKQLVSVLYSLLTDFFYENHIKYSTFVKLNSKMVFLVRLRTCEVETMLLCHPHEMQDNGKTWKRFSEKTWGEKHWAKCEWNRKDLKAEGGRESAAPLSSFTQVRGERTKFRGVCTVAVYAESVFSWTEGFNKWPDLWIENLSNLCVAYTWKMPVNLSSLKNVKRVGQRKISSLKIK